MNVVLHVTRIEKAYFEGEVFPLPSGPSSRAQLSALPLALLSSVLTSQPKLMSFSGLLPAGETLQKPYATSVWNGR